jgi:hypothetical protein
VRLGGRLLGGRRRGLDGGQMFSSYTDSEDRSVPTQSLSDEDGWREDVCTLEHQPDCLVPIPQRDRDRQLIAKIVDPSQVFPLRVETRDSLGTVKDCTEIADRATGAGEIVSRGRSADGGGAAGEVRDGRDAGCARDGDLRCGREM